MIRLLICDDQYVVREGLKAIFETDASLQVVGTAADGAEALEMIPQLQPDLVLMDLKMPVMNGVQATRHIRQKYPGIKILVLTTYDADEWVFDAIRTGRRGIYSKIRSARL
jgi:two-component system, NarL family, response regulator LiaR